MEGGLQESTKSAVRSGLGATVISRFGVIGELRERALVEIEITGLELRHDFYVVYHRDWPLSRLGDAFIRHARILALEHQ
jgi:DNA-binding transcriptional LysR family regulator